MEIKISSLYNKSMYLDKDIEFLKNVEITEFDIKSGGFNIIKYYGLLDVSKINYLETLNKKVRQYQIGMYQKEDKEFAIALEEGFRNARQLFFEANLIRDDDVLSIKRDAIFIVNRGIKHRVFGNIEFVAKNEYSSYYYLNKKEFYFKCETGKLDIKGIKDEEMLNHEVFISQLKRVFTMTERQEYKKYIAYLLKFGSRYLDMELPVESYRELEKDGMYRYHMENTDKFVRRYDIGLDYIDKENLHMLDISYNYIRYIVKLIQILV